MMNETIDIEKAFYWSLYLLFGLIVGTIVLWDYIKKYSDRRGLLTKRIDEGDRPILYIVMFSYPGILIGFIYYLIRIINYLL